MKRFDVIDLAARNLRESKLRNGLTTMGIAVGVASLVAMLALGVGLQEMASKRLGKSGLFENIVVSSRADWRPRGDTTPETGEPARLLDENARQEIAKLPNVLEVHPEIRLMTEVRLGEKTHFVFVGGLPPSAKDNEAFTDMKGSYFSSPTADEAVVQRDFAKEAMPENPDGIVGRELVLRYAERQKMQGGEEGEEGFSILRRERKLRVVGLVEQEPYGGMRAISRAGVLIPIALAENLNMVQPADVRRVVGDSADTKSYVSLIVRVGNPTAVQGVQDGIKKMGFSTFSLLDATRNLRRFFAVLDLFLGIFGSLALAVASLGIVNTLVMAILERRREIGIMKALGASDADVKKLFFAEAGAMGLVGGFLGIALGWLIGQGINFGTNIYLKRQALPPETVWVTPWWLVVGAVAFAIVVSLVSGLYPASRAAKLDPVQALRYE